MQKIKAVGFDLGDTLIEYEGFPLSWQHYYPEVLRKISFRCGCEPSEEKISLGEKILSGYNTRINPRAHEVDSDEIFTKILSCLELEEKFLSDATEEFFSFFQQKTKIFPETKFVLEELKHRGIKIGVLTDVPYGMKRKFVERDIAETNLSGYFDSVVTSGDVGFRKPNKAGYQRLLENFSLSPDEMIFVGNEQKDIIGANSAGIFSVLIDRKNICPVFGEKKKISSIEEILPLL